MYCAVSFWWWRSSFMQSFVGGFIMDIVRINGWMEMCRHKCEYCEKRGWGCLYFIPAELYKIHATVTVDCCLLCNTLSCPALPCPALPACHAGYNEEHMDLIWWRRPLSRRWFIELHFYSCQMPSNRKIWMQPCHWAQNGVGVSGCCWFDVGK